MLVEPVRLLSGEKGRDFVLIDNRGTERFSARLMDDSVQLVVTWTDNLPRTALRLRAVQALTGGPGRFTCIVGMATAELEESILSGTFDDERASRILGRSLGGIWRVQVVARHECRFPIYDIIAERVEESP